MKDDRVLIKHILEEIDFLLRETKGLTPTGLLADEKLKRACLRSLEVIGEAAKNVSAEYKAKHPLIEWKAMAGLRDKLIHFYFGVDWNIVHDVLVNKVPQLKQKIEELTKD